MSAALPIDTIFPEFLRSLAQTRNMVIEAPPGAGKTTRIPPALLDALAGEVLVLEPRRIAARMAARRVAYERGTRVGREVGYQVRFEDVCSAETRLRYLTEGVLIRRLLSDPGLRGVAAVVLDEFHERHLEGDLALALLRRLQLAARPDLRLIPMSATLDAAPVAAYLGGCPVLRSEGRLFDVAVSWSPHSAAPLEERVASAFESALRDGLDGDILVFLPGAAEIRRAARQCEGLARSAGMLVCPLHGDLPPEEQDRAVSPASQRKLILSTNVAESSITVDGVTVVIDSGLARIARDSQWTGLPTLAVQRISRASATQRAGRAGRTRPGRAIRLYPEDDFLRRPAEDVPEIRRRELSQVMLDLRALESDDLPWFEPPPEPAIRAATELLNRLGADKHGRAMARYPLHPRLARVLVEAEALDVTDDACKAVAILSSGDSFGDANLLHLLDRELPPRTEQIYRQVRRLARRRHRSEHAAESLAQALLAGFFDRAGRRRNDSEAQLSSGLAAAWNNPPGVDFFVALDIEDRPELRLPLLRLCAPIRPDLLLDLFPDRISEQRDLVWNRTAERVDAVSRIVYDELVLDETKGPPAADEQDRASRMLAELALDAGVHRFTDPDQLNEFLDRVAFASGHGGPPALGDQDVAETLTELARGLRSFEELRRLTDNGGLLRALRSRLGGAAALDDIAPERIRIGKRQVKVTYPRGHQPWVESRLQDFFGIRDTPRVARGSVPVVLHLLAPNRRPVQTTTDLAGFWQRLYPQVRRELMRRYPKHAWPEDPCGP